MRCSGCQQWGFITPLNICATFDLSFCLPHNVQLHVKICHVPIITYSGEKQRFSPRCCPLGYGLIWSSLYFVATFISLFCGLRFVLFPSYCFDSSGHAGVIPCVCQCSLVNIYCLSAYWKDTLHRNSPSVIQCKVSMQISQNRWKNFLFLILFYYSNLKQMFL